MTYFDNFWESKEKNSVGTNEQNNQKVFFHLKKSNQTEQASRFKVMEQPKKTQRLNSKYITLKQICSYCSNYAVAD